MLGERRELEEEEVEDDRFRVGKRGADERPEDGDEPEDGLEVEMDDDEVEENLFDESSVAAEEIESKRR